MKASKALACMKRAIEVAARSQPEDGRPHPSVGAVLSDLEGNIILDAARGEHGAGVHAEVGLLELAKKRRMDLSKCVVFSTLEPCTWRSRKHEPCAVRLEGAQVPLVYIGMLDPNLRICGRGESYLSYCAHVERFPDRLREQIVRMNERFVEAKKNTLIWSVRTYGIDPVRVEARPRQSILHLSQDLIVSGQSDVWISAGDLSWLKDLQPALLRTVLDGRNVRVLCNRPLSSELHSAALGLGLTLTIAKAPWPLSTTDPELRIDGEAVVLVKRNCAGNKGTEAATARARVERS